MQYGKSMKAGAESPTGVEDEGHARVFQTGLTRKPGRKAQEPTSKGVTPRSHRDPPRSTILDRKTTFEQS